MPVVTGQIDSYQVPENARDVSQAFYMINMPQTPLLNEIEIPGVAMNTKHNWWDDVRQPISTTLGGSYTSGGGTLTVAASAGLRVGSLFQVNSTVYRVTAVNSATSIDVAVADSGSDASHGSGDKVVFLGNASPEGKEYEDSDYTQREERLNVTQIFDDFVKITGTQQSINREAASGALLSQEVTEKLERLYLSLGRAIWRNPRVSPADNATARIMGGIDFFINQYGYVPSAAAFSAANFDAFILELEQEHGTVPGEVWMNPLAMANFADLDATKVELQREDQTRGVYVNRYITKYGHELVLRQDPNALPGKLYCFQRSQIRLFPLQSRQFQVVSLSKTGDNDKRHLLGEYTCEVRNGSTMGIFTPT
jgi:hypothetical protein